MLWRGCNQGTYPWNNGNGIWVVFDYKEKSSGFSRNTTRNELLWKEKQSRNELCNTGPVARVPYTIVYEQCYDGSCEFRHTAGSSVPTP